MSTKEPTEAQEALAITIAVVAGLVLLFVIILGGTVQ